MFRMNNDLIPFKYYLNISDYAMVTGNLAKVIKSRR